MDLKVFYSICERDPSDQSKLCKEPLFYGVADTLTDAFWNLHHFLCLHPILGRAEVGVCISVQDAPE